MLDNRGLKHTPTIRDTSAFQRQDWLREGASEFRSTLPVMLLTTRTD